MAKRKKPKQVFDEMGNATIRTNGIVQMLEDAFKMDYNITEACIHAGIARSSYYEWIAADKALADKMERAKKYSTMLAKRQSLRLMGKGDGAQVRFHLNARAKDPETGEHEYKNQQQVETDEVVEVDLGEKAEQLLNQFLSNGSKPKTTKKAKPKQGTKKVSRVAGPTKASAKGKAKSVGTAVTKAKK